MFGDSWSYVFLVCSFRLHTFSFLGGIILKSIRKIFVVLLAIITVITTVPIAAVSALVPKSSSSTIVYGSDNTITRAEWLHDLAVIFEMTVENGEEPDNYFADLLSTHKYYSDIILYYV